jgi:hypothetical protein
MDVSPHLLTAPAAIIAIALSAGVGLTLAACGSSNSSSGSGTTTSPLTAAQLHASYERKLALAKCMRAHGVTDFPDPGSPGGGRLIVQPGGSDAPALRGAMQACRKYAPAGLARSEKISASAKRAALGEAACMRSHGVPNFPDPSFPTTGGIVTNLPKGVNFASPAFQAAQHTCGGGGLGQVQAVPAS